MSAAARGLLWAFSAATSLYCLLCQVPLAWDNFMKAHIYPAWVDAFLKAHAAFLLLALGPAVWALRSGRSLFAIVSLLCGGPITWLLMSGRMRNDGTSLAASLLCWVPVLLWELLRHRQRPKRLAWTEPDLIGRRWRLPAALISAAAVFTTFSFWHLLRSGGTPATAAALALGWSLLSHAALFLCLPVGLDLISTAAGRNPARAARNEAALILVSIWIFLTWLLAARVFDAIAFSGPAAWLYAAVAAAAFSAAWFGQARDLRPMDAPVDDALGFMLEPLAAPWRPLASFPLGRFAGLALLAAVPGMLNAAITVDWDRLLAALAVLAAWTTIYALVYCLGKSLSLRMPRLDTRWAVGACILLAWGAEQGLSLGDPWLRLRGVAVAPAVRRLARSELSLHTVRRLLRAQTGPGAFHQFLKANTNIPRQTRIEPRDIILAARPAGAWPQRPHIFIFVLDSLRPDYIGAYNPKAGFTPALDAFAREALVWRNAFTAYGGTGLSEPSIWAGGRIPHKQYIVPFSPMNSLEKLICEEGYRSFMTRDVIIADLLRPDTALTRLADDDVGFHLCPALDELTGQIRQAGQARTPIFAYLQPQDLHVSIIDREGRKPVDARDYAGFYAPYASRVARMDACFGRFLAGLKQAGIYEDSVIVLTADHGDSLGEGDRWGHAYTIFPEILRVPLVIRAPRRLRSGLAWDLDRAVSLTDITPTLYELLGRPPWTDGEVLGRTLLASSREELARARRQELPVVSSYGPVYGLLRDNGRYLYINDAINFTSYYFDLAKDPKGETNLITPEIERSGDRAIRGHIESLNRFYRFQP
ncbi:MAG: sulfatase-like hydrolase/transferase [Elusimicrobiota bacterium]|jgi:hypothetical protein